MVDKMLDECFAHHEAEYEVVHDPFTMEMDILSAIRLIQKSERGRQGRDRVLMFLKEKQNKELATQKRQKMLENDGQEPEDEANNMILMIQNRIRGILARKEGEELRMKEMEFLGMAQKAKTQQEILNDPIEKMKKNGENRRMIRQTNEEDFNTAKELLKEEIANTEGVEISESMKKERRDWIQEYRGLHNGKPPADLKDFYNRFNVEPPLSPDEEEAKRL